MKTHSFNIDIMNKTINYRSILLALALVLIAPVSMAQPGSGDAKKKRDEKIEQLKIAFITKELDLTVDEAEKFWPAYNEMNTALKKERKARKIKSKKLKANYESMSETEVKKSSEAIMNSEIKESKLKKEHMGKVADVIGYKKAVKLLSLEQRFKRELLRKLNERKKELNGQTRPNGNNPQRTRG